MYQPLTSADQEKVEQYIRLFDGDTNKAVHSLRSYLERPRTPVESVKPNYDITDKPVVLEASGLTKQYKLSRKNTVLALNGVDVKIHQGEFVALTGASGSGKSTLLQLLGGLDKPTSGDVIANNVNMTKLRDKKLSSFRGQTIGFVFQFFYLQPFLKVRANLEVPGMFAGMKRHERGERIVSLAEAVGIADRLDHFPRELSGGQMQRVAIARALMNQPHILLADEPTGNLDSKNSDAIISLFQKIRQQFGTTIVIVTHDRAIAAQADREIQMSDGVVV